METMTDAGGVPERLRDARRAAGLTQEAAALLAGVHKVSVSRWESGRTIGTDDLAKLARTYGTTVAALLGEDSHAAISAGAADVDLPVDDKEPHPPEYYRGLQRGLMSTMEFVARSLRESIAAHDRAIAMQQEIIENTTPVARPAKVSKGSPAKRPVAEPEKRKRPG